MSTSAADIDNMDYLPPITISLQSSSSIKSSMNSPMKSPMKSAAVESTSMNSLVKSKSLLKSSLKSTGNLKSLKSSIKPPLKLSKSNLLPPKLDQLPNSRSLKSPSASKENILSQINKIQSELDIINNNISKKRVHKSIYKTLRLDNKNNNSSNKRIKSNSLRTITKLNVDELDDLDLLSYHKLSRSELLDQMSKLRSELLSLRNTNSLCSKCTNPINTDFIEYNCALCNYTGYIHSICNNKINLCYDCNSIIGPLYNTIKSINEINIVKIRPFPYNNNPNDLEIIIHLLKARYIELCSTSDKNSSISELLKIDLLLVNTINKIMDDEKYNFDDISTISKLPGGTAFLSQWLITPFKIIKNQSVLREWIKKSPKFLECYNSKITSDDVGKLIVSWKQKELDYKESIASNSKPIKVPNYNSESNIAIKHSNRSGKTPNRFVNSNIEAASTLTIKAQDKKKTYEELLKNDDFCFFCGEEGSLICCDGCPNSVHSKCLGKTFRTTTAYFCSVCETTACMINPMTLTLIEGEKAPKLQDLEY